MQQRKGKKIISGGKQAKVPVKIKSNFSEIDDFINKELGSLKGMKKTPIKPVRNKEAEKSKNVLKESMKSINLNEIKKKEIKEETMNSTATKFEGFNKAIKFNDSGTSFHPAQGTELKTSVSSSKMNTSSVLSKPEPFVINKFPEQSKNEKTKDIINDLNKSENKKPTTPKINIKPNEINLAKKIETETAGNKAFEPQINKIEKEEEEVYDEYDDFIEDDEVLKKIETKVEPKEEIDEFNTDGKEYNNIEDEVIAPRQEVPKTKREMVLKRVKDLKDAIELSSEMINLFEMDFTKDEDEEKKEEISIKKEETEESGVNTEQIETKENYTMMDNGSDLALSISSKVEKKKIIAKKENINEEAKEEKKEETKVQTINYQPITYDAYKFFIHIGPYMENVLLNNINKYILQNKSESSEATGFSKLDKDFTFPSDLKKYLFADCSDVKVSFRKYLFFDTKPFQIAFALTLSKKNSNPLTSVFSPISSDSCHLIILYSIFKSQIEHIYYSFSAIDDMVVIGESESILLSAKADGQVDVFDLYNNFNNEQYYMNYENNLSIARDKSFMSKEKKVMEPKFKLILPLISTNNPLFTSQIKKFAKTVNDSYTEEKIYTIYSIDQSGHFGSFVIRESFTHNYSLLENAMLSPEINFDLSTIIKRVFNVPIENDPECIDIKCYKERRIYLLTNFGLCAIDIEGKEHFIVDVIYETNNATNSNAMTAFDISDTGNLVCAFNDLSIKIYAKESKDVIYQSYAKGTSLDKEKKKIEIGLSEGASINKIVWSNIICKNGKGKLIRRSILTNFYVFSTKNDFVIFDLNQKNVGDIRKIKKLKELGAKNKLSRKNSFIDMSDSLFTDYSNFILQSNGKEDSEGKVEMYKLSLRKQYYEEATILKTNEKVMKKVLTLVN